MPKPSHRNYRYIPGLDGLRAVAVLAVIAYHFGLPGAQGGFLGVEMFFVLSGYLITDILINDRQTHGRIRLADFWLRRARRLLPAMLTMLAAVSLWLSFTDGHRLSLHAGDLASALLYVNNWWLVYHDVSYFESFGPPSPFGHLWSLAVEEQFYVIWPLVVALALKFVKRRGAVAAVALADALLSALAMGLLYVPGADPSRVYYGTDTRSFGMLIGAAAALLLPSAKLPEIVRGRGVAGLDAAGIAGLAVALVMIWRVGEYDASLYPGGFLLLAAATVGVIAAVAHPDGRLGRLLGARPLRWIGVRSYGIYLWHYPVFALTSPSVHTGGTDYGLMALQLALTFGLAVLSWRFVEEPIRSGAWRRRQAAAAVSGTPEVAKARRRKPIAVGFGVALLLGVMFASVSGNAVEVAAPQTGIAGSNGQQGTPEKAEYAHSVPGGSASGGSAKPAGPSGTNVAAPSAGTAPAGEPSGETGPGSEPSPSPSASPGADGPNNAVSGEGITVIGDSVILAVQPFLEEMLPGIRVDGLKGRQLYDAPELIEEMKEAGTLGSRVVIELGTNGSFSEKQLDRLLDSLNEADQILLINTRVPRKWQDNVNATLEKAAESRDNVILLDWYAASRSRDDYFYPDGVHLKPDGAKAYAELVSESVKS